MSEQSTLIAISEDLIADADIDHDSFIREQALKGLGVYGKADPAQVRMERVDSPEYDKLRQRLYRCSLERGENVQTGAPETRSA